MIEQSTCLLRNAGMLSQADRGCRCVDDVHVLQMSSPASVLSARGSGNRWGRTRSAPRRMTTKDCTSIVEGLRVIYFSKASRQH